MKAKSIIMYLGLFTVPMLAAFSYSIVTNQNISNDLTAYVVLVEADREVHIEAAKKYAFAARSFANDPQLYQFADKMYEALNAMDKMGIANVSEVGTISGLEKELEYAVLHPEFLPKSVYELVRTWNINDEIAAIDRKYLPQLQGYQREEAHRKLVSEYIVKIGYFIGALIILVQYYLKRQE